MIKIGIVGTGKTVGIANYHVKGLMNDGRAVISAIYNSHAETSEAWVRSNGIDAAICSSYEELLDKVDAVSICVPNAFHSEYAMKAVGAEKHFIVEKPLALTINECRDLRSATEGYPNCNMVGFVYRYSNAVQKAKQIVEERMGRVYTCSAWFGGKRLSDPTIPIEWRMIKDRSGAGALGDFGSHLVDMTYFVAGQKYENVTCMTDTVIPERQSDGGTAPVENDDLASFIAKSNNGIGTFTVSRVGMDDVMLMVTGEGGMLQLSLRGTGSLTWWEKAIGGGYSGKVEECAYELQTPFDGLFDSEMSAFLDRIEGKDCNVPDVKQGLYVEEVLHAASLSSISGHVEEVQI